MKRRTIIIVIIFAISIFNISAIATILFYNQNKKPTTESPSEIQLPEGHYARWFDEQLQLNDEQFEVFRRANRKYHHTGQNILDEMQYIRIEMLEELSKETSDTVLLHNYSQKIGSLHRELKDLTIEYYLEMKNVCDSSQREKLFRIFEKMIQEDENASIPTQRNNDF